MKITIAIPTFNRGKLALEKLQFLLENLNDEDIEILICDNCSDRQKDQYVQISEISKVTTNVIYIRRVNNGGLLGNFIEILENAKGKWLAIYSDEDYPNVDYINIIKNLSNENGIGIIRSGIMGDKGNSFVCEDVLVKSGIEAINRCGYHFNYISGIVYNLDEIKNRNLIEEYKKISWAHFDYPHLLMDTLICAQLNVLMTSKFSGVEGEPEFVDYSNNSNNYKLPYSLGARTDQFWSTWKSILYSIKIANIKIEGVEYGNLYINLCMRFSNLITFNFPLYQKNGFDLKNVVKTYISFMKSLAPKDYGYEVYTYLISSLEILYAQKIVQLSNSK